jgi:hypothetical protein
MWHTILKYGLIAGVVVGSILFGTMVSFSGLPPMNLGMVLGFGSMLLALSAVFVGIKNYRDHQLGGVIRFWPAFGMGLAISFIAGVCYVLAWEAALAVTKMDFGAEYAKHLIQDAQSKGVTGAALEKQLAELKVFAESYKNPLYRMPITFTEIFPVGILVSLVSAGLLRNSRFMPLKRA